MGMDLSPGMMGLMGGLAAGIMSSRGGQSMPQAQAPDPAPQASKAPDTQQVLNDMSGMGQAGGMPGNAQTFLSGPGGVSQDLLTTARNKLYGKG